MEGHHDMDEMIEDFFSLSPAEFTVYHVPFVQWKNRGQSWRSRPEGQEASYAYGEL